VDNYDYMEKNIIYMKIARSLAAKKCNPNTVNKGPYGYIKAAVISCIIISAVHVR